MTLKGWARVASREPLVHFLIGGLAVFGFSIWRGGSIDPESRAITIAAPQVERLVAQWQQTWRRPPTPAELDGLIRDYVKEEVYTREAIRLGLGEDDAVIRRRLRSKMEFLASSEVESATPDGATLQAWLDRNPARYAEGAKVSFDQIYLGESPDSAASVRAALHRGADWTTVGTSIPLSRSFDAQTLSDVERDFGNDFARSVGGLKTTERPARWQGPVPSGFGFHLVRVRAVTIGKPAKLSDVRQQVENDWRAATRQEREARAYQALLDGYKIRIEKP
jgi:peptidyl-prolyl cis-trans isomerase C